MLAFIIGLCNPAFGDAETKILSTDERSVTVSVQFEAPSVEWDEDILRDVLTVDGCGWIDSPGAPQLPKRRVRVGIPFGVAPSLRVLSLEEGGTLGTLDVAPVPVGRGARDRYGFGFIDHEMRPDEEIFRRDALFPMSVVEHAGVSIFRYQRVVNVDIYPVRWNPVTGGAQWIGAVTFEVTWTPAAEEKYQASAPVEPRLESFYSRVVANHETARLWRRAPVFHLKESVSTRQGEFKLVVAETGLYRVDFDDLGGTGTPIPVSDLGVYRKQYVEGAAIPYEEVPIPIHVVDEDEDGFFGESDWLYFWGMGFRDQFMVHDFEDRYADRNVYWLGWGEAGGQSMDTAGFAAEAGVDTLRSFPDEILYEEDHYNWLTPTTVDIDGIPPRADVDWWYWTSRTASGGSIGFEVFNPVTDSIPRMQIRFQGYITGAHPVAPTLVNGQSQIHMLGARTFQGASEFVYDTEDSIPAGFLTDGTNYFQFGTKGVSDEGKSAFGAFLDWIDVRYESHLTARDDYLVFNTGDLEQGAIRVDGFEEGSILLVDVTDPMAPKTMDLETGHVAEDGGEYRLVFPESTAVRRTYVGFTPGSAKRVEEGPLERSVEDPVWEREGDYLLITHEEFEDPVERLAGHRRSEGYQVQIVRVDAVYDAFNGGIKDPLAIKRYLQWAFDHWTVRPQFVTLVGDGSDDHRGLHPDSGPDFIPPPHFMWVEEPLPADNWYVDLDEDYTLDMYLGRLPVGSTTELDDLIDKIIAYEQFDPSDTWRGRFLAVSDDQCSTLGFTSYRCRAPQEDLFEEACRYSLSAAARSTGAPMDTLAIHMSQYTGYTVEEGWHPLCLEQDGDLNLLCLRDVVQDSLMPPLFDLLNEGVLMFQFQGHGNRSVMAHEYIVADGVYMGGGAYRNDVSQQLSNAGRPFLVATFGCHFADFSQTEENALDWQESLVEKMVLLPDGGAIAGLGPVGYEEYRIARAYQKTLADVMFDTAPWVSVAGETTGTRWLLGEIAAAMIVEGGYGQPSYRIALLGDPALNIDALPPGMTVTVDGVPVEDGDFLTSSGSSALAHIRAYIGDEVAVDTSSVRLFVRKGTSTTMLARDSDYSLAVADSVSGERVVLLEYTHEVTLDEYDVVIEAQDRNGRWRTFTLKVRFAGEVYFDEVRAYTGDYVQTGADVEIRLSLARSVPVGDLDVRLIGPQGEWIPDLVHEAQNPDSTQWDLRFALDGVSAGTYLLRLLVGGAETDLLRFGVESEFAVRDLTNFPNPFQDGTDIIFQLTAPASIELRIFTVAGKKLATFVTKGENGYNRIYWNGRDADGDEVANGVYLYRITAKTEGKEVRSEIQKAMRIR
jgi:hypothetical protein